ncbi:hypothetical protein [Lactobacillus sp.]|uniref:hypothetical protein n=1 Tax=Lactobacillus sp. TaxID=1591 RepID=UPI0019838D19|nr:hypothetical protein [Lactobacillus sp.]MBD5430149.1 hypothetical protein [Lactobacillus sp.]
MSQDFNQRIPYESVEAIIHAIKLSIKVACLARVVSYNKNKHVADIVPLVTSSEGEVSAQLLDVPVSRNCYEFDEYLEKIKSDYRTLDNNPKISTSLLSSIPSKPAMKKGAVVLVVFMDKNHDNWEGSNNFKPNTTRLHSINDAMIIGVM